MTTGNLTIQDNDTVVQYTAVGESSFVFNFPILENDELKVSRNGVLLTYGFDYSITGLGDDGGGSITLLLGASTPGDVWSLWQDMPIERLTGFSAGAAALLPEALNADFARAARVEQQLRREIRNSLRIPPDDPVSGQNMVLPVKTSRAGKYMAFDAAGQPIPAAGTGNDAALRTDLASGASGADGSRLISRRRTEAGAVSRTVFEILDEHASARDFLSAAPDGIVDNTAGLQNWLNCGAKKLYLPAYSQPYRASNLTQRVRSTIVGDAKRGSVIRQTATAAGALLSTEAGLPPSGATTDISDGGYGWQDLCLQPRALAGCHGLNMAAGVYGMLRARGLRVQSQQSETHAAVPYAIIPGQYGINISGAGGAVALFADFSDLEIRGFDVAFRARAVVNEMHIRGWFIDNKCGYDLQTVSSWQSHVAQESGVANACALRMDGPCANLHIWDTRDELTQLDSYIAEFLNAAAPDFANVHIWLPNILIAADGSAWPGRKYLASDGVRAGANGTLPPGVFFHVMTGSSPNFIWLNVGASASVQEFSPTVRVGGASKGDGKIILGRNAGAADSQLYYDLATGHTYLLAGNNLRAGGDGNTAFKFSVNSTGCGFNGNNPIAKPTTASAASAFIANAGTAVNDASTFDGYTIKQLAKAMRDYGLLT